MHRIIAAAYIRKRAQPLLLHYLQHPFEPLPDRTRHTSVHAYGLHATFKYHTMRIRRNSVDVGSSSARSVSTFSPMRKPKGALCSSFCPTDINHTSANDHIRVRPRQRHPGPAFSTAPSPCIFNLRYQVCSASFSCAVNDICVCAPRNSF
ncbi:hypothetical protein DENSPDRAFT_264619 [Dentipellis sp. KUC8613]|nr:hypothetical protein DENSPDRAFT_264619 [Dentipellis sp. KUC8613]